MAQVRGQGSENEKNDDKCSDVVLTAPAVLVSSS